MSIEKFTPVVFKKEPMPYTMVPNVVVQNMIHEPEALALWVYLISLPEIWTISKKFIINKFHWGRDKVNRCLSVLESHGLLEKIQERSDGGRFDKLVINILNGTRFRQNGDFPTNDPNTESKSNTYGCRSTESTYAASTVDAKPPTINNNKNLLNKRKKEKERNKKYDPDKNRQSQTLLPTPSFTLPTCTVKPELWQDYLEHRKAMKAPLSMIAQAMALTRLNEFKEAGYDIDEIVTNSIVNGWKGLFAPDGQANGSNFKQGAVNGSTKYNERNGNQDYGRRKNHLTIIAEYFADYGIDYYSTPEQDLQPLLDAAIRRKEAAKLSGASLG